MKPHNWAGRAMAFLAIMLLPFASGCGGGVVEAAAVVTIVSGVVQGGAAIESYLNTDEGKEALKSETTLTNVSKVTVKAEARAGNAPDNGSPIADPYPVGHVMPVELKVTDASGATKGTITLLLRKEADGSWRVVGRPGAMNDNAAGQPAGSEPAPAASNEQR